MVTVGSAHFQPSTSRLVTAALGKTALTIKPLALVHTLVTAQRMFEQAEVITVVDGAARVAVVVSALGVAAHGVISRLEVVLRVTQDGTSLIVKLISEGLLLAKI